MSVTERSHWPLQTAFGADWQMCDRLIVVVPYVIVSMVLQAPLLYFAFVVIYPPLHAAGPVLTGTDLTGWLVQCTSVYTVCCCAVCWYAMRLQ